MVYQAPSNHTSSAFFQTSSSQAACKSCSWGWGRGDAPRPCPDSALAKSLVGELSEAALLKLGRRMLELSRRKFELLRCRPELLRCSSDPPEDTTTTSAIDPWNIFSRATHSSLSWLQRLSAVFRDIAAGGDVLQVQGSLSPDTSGLNMTSVMLCQSSRTQ